MDSSYPMEIFLTCAGFIIGISAFLYLVSLIDSGKRKAASYSLGKNKLKKTIAGKNIGTNVVVEARQRVDSTITQLDPTEKDRIPKRVCPMCSRTLQRDEPLYATHMDIGKEKKVFIHGCPYCYKPSK